MLFEIALVTGAAGLGTAWYKLFFQDPHIDWRVKAAHYFMRGAFRMGGVGGDGKNFNRKYLAFLSKPAALTDFGSKDGVKTEDLYIPFGLKEQTGWEADVLCRLFIPTNNTQTKKLPLLIYSHGGGFTLGSALSIPNDEFARYLSSQAMMYVLSVDYRKAPEHPFPCAILDIYSAYMWVANRANNSVDYNYLFDNVDFDRIYIGGDSAGASLSIATISIIKHGLKYANHFIQPGTLSIRQQILFYPALNLKDTPSRKLKNTYMLTTEDIAFFTKIYITDEKYLDPKHEHSHLLDIVHPDYSLEGFPSAIVITADYDLLHDDGQVYAQELERAGVIVEYASYKAMHGFITFHVLNECTEARRFVIDTMKKKGLVGEVSNQTSV